jgi:radial spoke head protein 4A
MEQEINHAKQYFMQNPDRTGINLYDHLTELLSQILEKKPKNPVGMLRNG